MKFLKKIFESAILQWSLALIIPQILAYFSGLWEYIAHKLLAVEDITIMVKILLMLLLLLLMNSFWLLYQLYPKFIRNKYKFDDRLGIYFHKKTNQKVCHKCLNEKIPRISPVQNFGNEHLCGYCKSSFDNPDFKIDIIKTDID